MAGMIPRHFIDDLLERVDIVEVIDRRVTLKKSGRNYSACCPFHDEKTPSFSVNPDKQFFYCFGCGAGGNSISFIMDYDNLDFPEAVESLATLAGIEVPREEPRSDYSAQRAQQQKQQVQSLYGALEWTTRHFQRQLRQHPQRKQAVDYLKQRGLTGEIARDFGIGYAPPGWSHLLDQLAKDNQPGLSSQQLEAGGMLIKKDNGDYYDRFRERIMFPIRDNRGRVIAFGGRVLNDDKPKYLNSPETDVFHKQKELYGLYEARKANRQLDYLLLVEGYMDVVSLFQHGITQCVATLGTASSIYHLEKIFRHTARLVVCFDADEAGKKAAHRLLETALPTMKDGREIHFLFLPEGEDPDTFVRDKGKPAFEAMIAQAQPLEALLFDIAETGVQLSTGAGKAKFAQTALPMIEQLPSGVFKELILSQLSEMTGAELATLKQQATQFKRRDNTRHASSAPTPNPGNQSQGQTRSNGNTPSQPNQQNAAPAKAINRPEEFKLGIEKTPMIWAIALLLHFPDLAREITLSASVKELAGNDEQLNEAKLLITLVDHIVAQPEGIKTHALLGYWHGTAEAVALNHCANHHDPPNEETIARLELSDVLANIDQSAKDAERRQLVEQWRTSPPETITDEVRAKLAALNSRAHRTAKKLPAD